MHLRRRAGTRGGGGRRLAFASVIALVAIIACLGRTSTNPVRGQSQRVAMSVDQEIALGLQSAPQMAAQFGGLHPDPGNRIARIEAVIEEMAPGSLPPGLDP